MSSFYMDNDANTPENIHNIIKGFAWLLREKRIDTVIALDDFDVEKSHRHPRRIPHPRDGPDYGPVLP